LAPLLADLITLDAIFARKGPARFQQNLSKLANAIYSCRDELRPLAGLPAALYFTLSIQKKLTSLQKNVEPKVEPESEEEEEDSDTAEIDGAYFERNLADHYKITEEVEQPRGPEDLQQELEDGKLYEELDDEVVELVDLQEAVIAVDAIDTIDAAAVADADAYAIEVQAVEDGAEQINAGCFQMNMGNAPEQLPEVEDVAHAEPENFVAEDVVEDVEEDVFLSATTSINLGNFL